MRWNVRVEGPESAFVVARKLGMRVVLDRDLRVRGWTELEERCIWIRWGERGSRMEHALAHEIGHHHVFDQAIDAALLERACDRFAAALMLPRYEFAAAAREVDYDPVKLAAIWKYSSLEAVARRLADVLPAVSVAAWVNFTAKWREPVAPSAELVRMETQALGEAYCRAKGVTEARSAAGRVRVWRTNAMRPHRAVSLVEAA